MAQPPVTSVGLPKPNTFGVSIQSSSELDGEQTSRGQLLKSVRESDIACHSLLLLGQQSDLMYNSNFETTECLIVFLFAVLLVHCVL